MQFCIFGLESLDPSIELVDDRVFALDESVDEFLLVVLFRLLLSHLLDLNVDKLHLLSKLLRLQVLAVEVPLELSHQQHVVRLDHPLKRQSQLRLETDQVIEDGDKAGIQSR